MYTDNIDSTTYLYSLSEMKMWSDVYEKIAQPPIIGMLVFHHKSLQ